LALLGAAVGFPADSRPGRRAVAAVPVAGPVSLPPPDALVLGRQDGPWAVALAVRGRELTVTAIGQEGNGVDGLSASIGGATATQCGHGCYRTTLAAAPRRVAVRLAGTEVVFEVPVRAPVAGA